MSRETTLPRAVSVLLFSAGCSGGADAPGTGALGTTTSPDGSLAAAGASATAISHGNGGTGAVPPGAGSVPGSENGSASIPVPMMMGAATVPSSPTPTFETPPPATSAAEPEVCVAQTSEATLKNVVLAFGFDVSGSMGKGDEEWHDKSLKWDPVVAATKAFFAAPESKGLSASLTFFPIDEDEDERCASANYEVPDVALTPLPSDAFGAAIDDIAPEDEDDWRGGTPTLAIIQGARAFLEPLVAANPDTSYVFVLVTDGTPQGCSDEEDEIETVVQAVEGLAVNIATYVVGVANPPGGPDSVSGLNALAAAGGTEQAFIVETGDPETTTTRLLEVIDSIRASTVACEVTIPVPPEGQTFDPTLVNVSYTSGTELTQLGYDPECLAPDAWRYDDPDLPTQVVLCSATCDVVQVDTQAKLDVAFGCVRQEATIR